MKMELIRLVDRKNMLKGYAQKEEAHRKRLLHEAVILFLFNRNQLLIQQRSRLKQWPDFWDCSLATHVRKNESPLKAVRRRMKEELGIKAKTRIKIKKLFTFEYHAKFKNNFEDEICHAFSASYGGKIKVNKKEIKSWKFISLDDLKKARIKLTPWFLISLKKLR